MHEYQNGCYCSAGSMTQAMRAQRVLADAAIQAQIVKLDNAHRGCAYALSFCCAQENNVRTILARAGLHPREFFRGGDA